MIKWIQVKIVAYSEKEQKEIIAALNAKIPNPPSCALCGKNQWQISGKYIYLVLQEEPKSLTSQNVESLPCIAIICGNCGNTHLLNMYMLGVGHLTGLIEKKESQ